MFRMSANAAPILSARKKIHVISINTNVTMVRRICSPAEIVRGRSDALLIFNEEGRLQLWNTPYENLFKADIEFLKTEPLLIDVLDTQKTSLVLSDDIWDLLRQKILLSLDDENEKLDLVLLNETKIILKSNRLPDGGLMLRYEI